MHGEHLSLAGLTLFWWAGGLVAAGSACVLWSQVPSVADYLRSIGHGASRRQGR